MVFRKARYRRDARARTEISTALYCAEIDQNMRLYGCCICCSSFSGSTSERFFLRRVVTTLSTDLAVQTITHIMYKFSRIPSLHLKHIAGET